MAEVAKARQLEKSKKAKKDTERIQKERDRIVEQQINGLQVILHPVKHRCVVTRRKFSKGEVVCIYPGEWISRKEALKREKVYDKHPELAGSFLFWTKIDGSWVGLDATLRSRFGHCIGRYVNHSRNPNLTPSVESHFGDGNNYLVLRANQDILPGSEVAYDYSENRPDIRKANTWIDNS